MFFTITFIAFNKSYCYNMHMSSSKTTITAQVPKTLAERLDSLAKAENRSKSYYIQTAIKGFLDTVTQDLLDYMEAGKRYEEFLSTGSTGLSLADMKNKYNL